MFANVVAAMTLQVMCAKGVAAMTGQPVIAAAVVVAETMGQPMIVAVAVVAETTPRATTVVVVAAQTIP